MPLDLSQGRWRPKMQEPSLQCRTLLSIATVQRLILTESRAHWWGSQNWVPDFARWGVDGLFGREATSCARRGRSSSGVQGWIHYIAYIAEWYSSISTSVMVWGSIHYEGKSLMVIVGGSKHLWESKRVFRLTAEAFCETLSRIGMRKLFIGHRDHHKWTP